MRENVFARLKCPDLVFIPILSYPRLEMYENIFCLQDQTR